MSDRVAKQKTSLTLLVAFGVIAYSMLDVVMGWVNPSSVLFQDFQNLFSLIMVSLDKYSSIPNWMPFVNGGEPIFIHSLRNFPPFGIDVILSFSLERLLPIRDHQTVNMFRLAVLCLTFSLGCKKLVAEWGFDDRIQTLCLLVSFFCLSNYILLLPFVVVGMAPFPWILTYATRIYISPKQNRKHTNFWLLLWFSLSLLFFFNYFVPYLYLFIAIYFICLHWLIRKRSPEFSFQTKCWRILKGTCFVTCLLLPTFYGVYTALEDGEQSIIQTCFFRLGSHFSNPLHLLFPFSRNPSVDFLMEYPERLQYLSVLGIEFVLIGLFLREHRFYLVALGSCLTFYVFSSIIGIPLPLLIMSPVLLFFFSRTLSRVLDVSLTKEKSQRTTKVGEIIWCLILFVGFIIFLAFQMVRDNYFASRYQLNLLSLVFLSLSVLLFRWLKDVEFNPFRYKTIFLLLVLDLLSFQHIGKIAPPSTLLGTRTLQFTNLLFNSNAVTQPSRKFDRLPKLSFDRLLGVGTNRLFFTTNVCLTPATPLAMDFLVRAPLDSNGIFVNKSSEVDKDPGHCSDTTFSQMVFKRKMFEFELPMLRMKIDEDIRNKDYSIFSSSRLRIPITSEPGLRKLFQFELKWEKGNSKILKPTWNHEWNESNLFQIGFPEEHLLHVNIEKESVIALRKSILYGKLIYPDIGVVPVRVSPHKLEVKTSSDKPGWVYVLDSYDKRWEAQIDSQKTSIVRANLFYKAVFVPIGTHTLKMFYHPVWYFRFLFFSLAGFSCVLILVLWQLRGKAEVG